MKSRDFWSQIVSTTLLVALLLLGAVGSGTAVAFHFPWDQGHDTFQPEEPEDEDPPEDDDPCESDAPVILATGAKTYEQTDFDIPGIGPKLSLRRVYHSNDRSDGPFGIGWRSTLTPRAVRVTDGVSVSVVSCQGNGRRKRFLEQADGSFLSAPGTYQTLTRLADNSLELRDKNGSVSVFDASGYLQSRRDRFGNRLLLSYTANGQLTSVTDSSGRAITFVNGPNGRIAEVIDPAGRSRLYDYDEEGHLVAITDPLGNVTTYAYDIDHNLVRVVDGSGNVVFELTYDTEGRVVREQLADGSAYSSITTIPAKRG